MRSSSASSAGSSAAVAAISRSSRPAAESELLPMALAGHQRAPSLSLPLPEHAQHVEQAPPCPLR